MRYCINCGSMNDTDAKFCSGCGKKFESAPDNEPVKEDYTTEKTASDAQNTSGAYNYQNQYQNANQPYNYGNTQNPMSDGKYKGYSVASMILGICSIVLNAFIPLLPLAAGIVGLVLGKKVKKYGDNGMAKAGRITSIVGIILTALMVVMIIVAVIILTVAIVDNPEILDDLQEFVNGYSYFY